MRLLLASLEQYVNHELSDVEAGFGKGRGTRDQIANIRCIIKKQESSRKTSALLTAPKPLTVWIKTNCGKFLKRWEYLFYLLPEKFVWWSRSNGSNWTWNNGLVPNGGRNTSRLNIVTLLI